MAWHPHSWVDFPELEDKHALMSPSNPYWLRYTDEQVIDMYNGMMRKIKGTELHEWAENTIRLGITQSSSKKTLYMYVNDAIRYKMRVEQKLYYGKYCHGKADAIMCDGKILRIHDLKTGEIPGKIDQLIVYAALYCLQYNQDPHDFAIELRIYQADQIVICKPTAEDVIDVMNKIVHNHSILDSINSEEL